MEAREIIPLIVALIRKHLAPETYQILLFGSQVRGDAYPTSDVDIGIVGDHPVPFHTMAQILDEKDALPTLRTIDVVDLGAVDVPFRESVLSYAKRI